MECFQKGDVAKLLASFVVFFYVIAKESKAGF